MLSVPPGMWRVSRWLRVYDWDWGRRPFPGVNPVASAYRAETYPRRFFYHVLRVIAPEDRETGQADAVEYDQGVHALLAACFEPVLHPPRGASRSLQRNPQRGGLRRPSG